MQHNQNLQVGSGNTNYTKNISSTMQEIFLLDPKFHHLLHYSKENKEKNIIYLLMHYLLFPNLAMGLNNEIDRNNLLKLFLVVQRSFSKRPLHYFTAKLLELLQTFENITSEMLLNKYQEIIIDSFELQQKYKNLNFSNFQNNYNEKNFYKFLIRLIFILVFSPTISNKSIPDFNSELEKLIKFSIKYKYIFFKEIFNILSKRKIYSSKYFDLNKVLYFLLNLFFLNNKEHNSKPDTYTCFLQNLFNENFILTLNQKKSDKILQFFNLLHERIKICEENKNILLDEWFDDKFYKNINRIKNKLQVTKREVLGNNKIYLEANGMININHGDLNCISLLDEIICTDLISEFRHKKTKDELNKNNLTTFLNIENILSSILSSLKIYPENEKKQIFRITTLIFTNIFENCILQNKYEENEVNANLNSHSENNLQASNYYNLLMGIKTISINFDELKNTDKLNLNIKDALSIIKTNINNFRILKIIYPKRNNILESNNNFDLTNLEHFSHEQYIDLSYLNLIILLDLNSKFISSNCEFLFEQEKILFLNKILGDYPKILENPNLNNLPYFYSFALKNSEKLKFLRDNTLYFQIYDFIDKEEECLQNLIFYINHNIYSNKNNFKINDKKNNSDILFNLLNLCNLILEKTIQDFEPIADPQIQKVLSNPHCKINLIYYVFKILDFNFNIRSYAKFTFYYCINKKCRKKLKKESVIFYNKDFYSCNHCGRGHIAMQLDSCFFTKKNVDDIKLKNFFKNFLQNLSFLFRGQGQLAGLVFGQIKDFPAVLKIYFQLIKICNVIFINNKEIFNNPDFNQYLTPSDILNEINKVKDYYHASCRKNFPELEKQGFIKLREMIKLMKIKNLVFNEFDLIQQSLN
jgi:hypothetical protein